MKNPWYIYILRCENNSLYTGITTDYDRRFLEHSLGMGAKYTKIFKPKYIEVIFCTENRSFASKIEYFIKKFSSKKKEQLILEPNLFLKTLKLKFDFEISYIISKNLF